MLNTIISKQHAILGNSCTCTFDLSVVRLASIIRGLIIYKELSDTLKLVICISKPVAARRNYHKLFGLNKWKWDFLG